MIYLRYEFNDKEQAEDKIAKLEDVNAAFIRLNKFVITEGTYDSEGVEITAPVMSTGLRSRRIMERLRRFSLWVEKLRGNT